MQLFYLFTLKFGSEGLNTMSKNTFEQHRKLGTDGLQDSGNTNFHKSNFRLPDLLHRFATTFCWY